MRRAVVPEQMPRKSVETHHHLEHVSVLGQDGSVDTDLEPTIDDARLRALHETMLLSRRLDERMLSLQRQGRLGTFAPAIGQEASQLGSVGALKDSDWVVPSYRETTAALWRGIPIEGLLLYNAGFQEGGQVPEGSNFLPISIPVGSQALHAAGLAYGFKVRRKDQERAVALSFFGDGATSEGDFHEALNFAGVFGCPVVFLCQNNQWAISVPRSQQTQSRTLAQKAFAYGLPGIQVDGNDILAVYVACQEAIRRAREEETPTLIECITYRISVHTTVDDPDKYRQAEEVEEWKQRDPLPRLQNYLVQKKQLLSEDDIEQLEQKTQKGLDEAVESAESQMKEFKQHPSRMFEHLLAEKPQALAEQQAEFEEIHG